MTELGVHSAISLVWFLVYSVPLILSPTFGYLWSAWLPTEAAVSEILKQMLSPLAPASNHSSPVRLFHPQLSLTTRNVHGEIMRMAS